MIQSGRSPSINHQLLALASDYLKFKMYVWKARVFWETNLLKPLVVVLQILHHRSLFSEEAK